MSLQNKNVICNLVKKQQEMVKTTFIVWKWIGGGDEATR